MLATASSSDSQMRETWLELMRSMPMARATFSTFLVEAPFANISETAAATARSVRDQRVNRSSG